MVVLKMSSSGRNRAAVPAPPRPPRGLRAHVELRQHRARRRGGGRLGLGLIVTSRDRSPTLYRTHEEIRCLCF